MPLKIIAGKYRGRNINTPAEGPARPLLARAKKSLFDILTPKIVNSVFLDLFAGYGSVGIEALSRGAKRAVFVETDRNCVEVIEENLKNLGAAESAEIIQRDAARPDFLEDKFDIIFIGPPYKMKMLADIIGKSEKLLRKNGIIIGQHHKKEVLAERIGEVVLYRQEKYGDMVLSFYRKI